MFVCFTGEIPQVCSSYRLQLLALYVGKKEWHREISSLSPQHNFYECLSICTSALLWWSPPILQKVVSKIIWKLWDRLIFELKKRKDFMHHFNPFPCKCDIFLVFYKRFESMISNFFRHERKEILFFGNLSDS